MRKATRAQWVKFGIVTLLYLMFLVWVKSWWGLIVVIVVIVALGFGVCLRKSAGSARDIGGSFVD